jgi:hypothetical protein
MNRTERERAMGSSGRMNENMDPSHYLDAVSNSGMSSYGLMIFAPLISWPINEMA